MTDDYTKSLEETVRKLEGVINDYLKDRENISKLLGTLVQSSHEICGDIELLANPKNPLGGEKSASIMRGVIKDKLIQMFKKFANDIVIVSSYTKQDPSEYRSTGVYDAVPRIHTVKDPS